MIDIQSDKALAGFCAEASRQDAVAIDTEFIRERTFYPILALIQVNWKTHAPVLIDPLQISDWAPFHDLLKNPDICKIFHAGRQDIEIFYYQMGEMPLNLFDTQIAASMCGYGDQIGYSALVSRLLGTQLAKGSSFTNWLQRPLTESQLNYARDDVLYLPAVYDRLIKRAESKNRLSWIREETSAQLNHAVFEPDPNSMWRKVKKANSLSPRNMVVLQALARWRYETARRLDKPLRFVVSDEAMIELAKVEKLNYESLHARRGMQSKIIERHGHEIIDTHARARTIPKSEWPVTRNSREKPPGERSEALADLSWLLIKEIARNADIAPTHLINKKELAGLIESYFKEGDLSGYPVGEGWRGEMIGKPLVDLIEGRIAIHVRDHRIVWDGYEDGDH
ncbi:MAG: ribonuclease D [Acidobacteriota bacterium]|nr:ribonuclease D [Acidobacteriota bacterium]